MERERSNQAVKRCLFCHMETDLRLYRLWTCAICRDQLYDFAWATVVQAIVVFVFSLGGIFFLVEEVLLFTVLVFVKHRVPPPWERNN